jgi:hypothetical protein
VGAIDRQNLDLLVLRDGKGYRARVIRSPGGEGDASFAMPDGRQNLERLLTGAGPRRSDATPTTRDVIPGRAGRLRPTAMADFGRRLFTAVFSGTVAVCYRRSLEATERQGQGLRIRLRLTDVPELLDMPWELLYDGARNEFLASSNRTPLLRYLDLVRPLEPLAVEGPLRMLVVVSSPEDRPKLEVPKELARLEAALAGLTRGRRIDVDPVKAGTREELRAALRRVDHHVLHFIGHGGFDPSSQQGLLLLRADDGASDPIRAEDLSGMLAESESLRLVVLNTCEGARGSVVDPFAGTAQSLVAHGIPAAVAMQFEVTDEAAVGFAQGFYTSVAAGAPVEDAVTQGRLSMATYGDGAEWATPVLYTHTEDTTIFSLRPVEADGAVDSLPGRGTVVAGQLVIQVEPMNGVRIDKSTVPVVPRARPAPVAVLPPPFPLLMGRDAELLAASQAGTGVVQFHAEAGWGKSALLRAWAYRSVGEAPGGLLFLRSLSRPAMDVLQFLFEELFESAVPFKPDEAQLRTWMGAIEAAVVLDDAELKPEELDELRAVMPRCRFIIAGRRLLAAGDQQQVALGGLPLESGVALVELELGRTLEDAEARNARRICEAVRGSPARILAEAERSWREGRSLAEVASSLEAESGVLAGWTDGPRAPEESRVLSVLGSLHPAPLHANHLIALADLNDPVPVLESLERRQLIASGSPMYTLAVPFVPPAAGDWSGRVFDHLSEWAVRATPQEVLRDVDALVAAMRLGREGGRDRAVAVMGRAMEGPLIAGRRWGQWGRVLQIELSAAMVAADAAAEGWASHQLGSRALGLGDPQTARANLGRAVQIRDSIGDRAGAEVSRHNLELAGGTPTPPEPSDGGEGPPKPPDGGAGVRWGLWLGTIGALGLIGFLVWFFVFRDGRPPTPVGTPVRQVAPSPVDFGNVTVGTDSTVGITVSNGGGGTLTVTGVTLEPAVESIRLGGNCEGAALAAGDSCRIEVTFSPPGEGRVEADLVIEDDTGGAAERVRITGGGVPEPLPAVGIDPAAIDFGQQPIGTEAAAPVIVTNTGQADLRIREVSREGDPAFTVAGQDCRGATVPPGASCSIDVAFAPVARGLVQGQLVLLDNAGEGRQTIPLTGTGVTDLPDLIVSTFRTTGEAFDGGDGEVHVPVEVVVRNDADVEARVFKVAVEFTGAEGSSVVRFLADRSDDVDPNGESYPFTTRELGPDREVVFTGRLRFIDDGVAETVTAVAIADSCLGDEGLPPECRVAEVTEENNRSSPVSIEVPTYSEE